MADPRPNAKHQIGICGFADTQTQGPYDVLESMCGCGFLGNSFIADLDLEVNGMPMRFTNAEAAFQALMFSTDAKRFEKLSGEESLQLSKDLSDRGFGDPEHGGYGTIWKAMHAVLKAKFKVNTPLAIALEKTGDDFPLCHSFDHDPNAKWSNGANGQGTNWLGMQLMLIRSTRTGWKRWATFIQSQIDVVTGRPLYNCRDNHFQAAVQTASEALKAAWIAQQPAITAPSAAAVLAPAGQQHAMMVDAAGIPLEQQRGVLQEGYYDEYRDPLTGCQACGGTGTDFMGHPCACSNVDFQHPDDLQYRHELHPPDWEDNSFNGAMLHGTTPGQYGATPGPYGATPGQYYSEPFVGQPHSSGSPGRRY